jgi:hypothetical protein
MSPLGSTLAAVMATSESRILLMVFVSSETETSRSSETSVWVTGGYQDVELGYELDAGGREGLQLLHVLDDDGAEALGGLGEGHLEQPALLRGHDDLGERRLRRRRGR